MVQGKETGLYISRIKYQVQEGHIYVEALLFPMTGIIDNLTLQIVTSFT